MFLDNVTWFLIAAVLWPASLVVFLSAWAAWRVRAAKLSRAKYEDILAGLEGEGSSVIEGLTSFYQYATRYWSQDESNGSLQAYAGTYAATCFNAAIRETARAHMARPEVRRSLRQLVEDYARAVGSNDLDRFQLIAARLGRTILPERISEPIREEHLVAKFALDLEYCANRIGENDELAAQQRVNGWLEELSGLPEQLLFPMIYLRGVILQLSQSSEVCINRDALVRHRRELAMSLGRISDELREGPELKPGILQLLPSRFYV